jgi:transcription initiation factor TFIID subunit 7
VKMLICTDEKEARPPPAEEHKPRKHNKVDKKYLHPHGITPPLKNVRKRRFRKTLKNKVRKGNVPCVCFYKAAMGLEFYQPEILTLQEEYMDQAAIEREVRRLLRDDYEADHVSWEVVDEEEDKTKEAGGGDVLMGGSQTNEEPTKVDRMVTGTVGGRMDNLLWRL